jgi:hypothetical protein
MVKFVAATMLLLNETTFYPSGEPPAKAYVGAQTVTRRKAHPWANIVNGDATGSFRVNLWVKKSLFW